MAQLFTVYIYGIDAPGGNTEIAAAGGEPNDFAPGTTHVYPTSSVRGRAQVTCNAVIELLPTGLNQQTKKFYTAKTPAEIATLANA